MKGKSQLFVKEDSMGLVGNDIGKRVKLFLYIVFATSLGQEVSLKMQGMVSPCRHV